MAGVVFIFVREDASEAETLAEAFDAAGYAITGGSHEDALSIIIWSRAALRSSAFRSAAEHALRSGQTIIASLIAPPTHSVLDAPVIDLSAWDGEDGRPLAPLLNAADDMARPTQARVIQLPARPIYEDAEFSEVAPAAAVDDRQARARQSWEAPLPTIMLRPVPEAEPSAKLGAPTPRRDFRRLHQRKPASRAHSALVFALIAVVGGGMFAMTLVPRPVAHVVVAEAPAATPAGGISLTSASADAMGLEDTAPVEPVRFGEPVPQIGRRGVEPPSARSIRRARYAPGDDRAAYSPPSLIPEAIVADLDARADSSCRTLGFAAFVGQRRGR